MLNEFGKLIGDFTIARLADERFMIWGSSAAQVYHMRWFERHLPDDGSVSVQRFGMQLNGLSIAGPNSRKVLEKLVDTDVSNEAFRFMDSREIDVQGSPCIVSRISYTGDLGYEIWCEPAYTRQLYRDLKEAGQEFGIRDFGMRALLSMRLEKNFPTWGHELRPVYGPFEGSMDRFVKLSKNNFIGREAAAEEHAKGPKIRRVSFIIDADNADVMHDEPVWAKTSTDYGNIDHPHEGGPKRFTSDNKELPYPGMSSMVDGDWRVVGYVTSGGYAHGVGKSMAQGYVPAELSGNESEDMFEIEILGVRRKARINVDPPFDPAGERMRG
jgi:dimethylglycine dehydrogenase